ncbi:hypothetical protein PGTUg99_004969 [Puccinia graminis f. sp. tritici]|uniref:Uncharacterized protein n=1 Tax=Puccinia graminis f. sp. tritici TaxID=56615 RepID=A0A5B0RRJ8_PUCGR|nr:hypothetical protein PGTUg99_004969 [Puccinia graminis f. sp. tritici]
MGRTDYVGKPVSDLRLTPTVAPSFFDCTMILLTDMARLRDAISAFGDTSFENEPGSKGADQPMSAQWVHVCVLANLLLDLTLFFFNFAELLISPSTNTRDHALWTR